MLVGLTHVRYCGMHRPNWREFRLLASSYADSAGSTARRRLRPSRALRLVNVVNAHSRRGVPMTPRGELDHAGARLNLSEPG
jgi:hypothetical protein